MKIDVTNTPIENFLFNLQCDLISQTEILRKAIVSEDYVELTNAFYKWLEIRDNIINCNKVKQRLIQKNLKTKFWFEVNDEDQLELFNVLFDKMYYASNKEEMLEQFLIDIQCRLMEQSEKLQSSINSNDPIELTDSLCKWLELKDIISFGIKIKNIFKNDAYRNKFGINVNSEEQLKIFNKLFDEMKDSSEKERVFEQFLISGQCRLIEKTEQLQKEFLSEDYLNLTTILYNWLEIRDTILISSEVKSMLNQDAYNTKFGMILNNEEQVELFNKLFDEMIDYIEENDLFQNEKSR